MAFIRTLIDAPVRHTFVPSLVDPLWETLSGPKRRSEIHPRATSGSLNPPIFLHESAQRALSARKTPGIDGAVPVRGFFSGAF